MNGRIAGLLAVAVIAVVLAAPGAASAATCSDYSTQAEAQRAADTRDADGDGIYCESLPCPCLKAGSPAPKPTPKPQPKPKTKKKASSCSRPSSVVTLRFSASKYPTIMEHMQAAITHGWPRVMVLNRKGADDRRDRLMQESIPVMDGMDRDEYPAAVGRGRADGKKKGLVRGTNPKGWMADVAYVPTSENRSHGASLGNKLRKYCNGTRFRYSFR